VQRRSAVAAAVGERGHSTAWFPEQHDGRVKPACRTRPLGCRRKLPRSSLSRRRGSAPFDGWTGPIRHAQDLRLGHRCSGAERQQYGGGQQRPGASERRLYPCRALSAARATHKGCPEPPKASTPRGKSRSRSGIAQAAKPAYARISDSSVTGEHLRCRSLTFARATAAERCSIPSTSST
jgi:hypothetical protein